MAKKQKQVTVEVNEQQAVMVAKKLLEMFDGMPAEATKTVLNGFSIAMVQMLRGTQACCQVSDEDGLEKMVLSWFAATDPVSGLHFSKYICLEGKDNKED